MLGDGDYEAARGAQELRAFGEAAFMNKAGDNVNHPQHYKSAAGIEVIDVIEAFGLGFHLGNVVKYVLRAPNKNGIEDLKKARWYLDREIARKESK